MLLVVILTIQLLSAHCGAQQTYARRDPRIRQTVDHLHLNDQIATLNATSLFGQLPAQRYSQPHYSTSLRATPPDVAKYRNLGNYFQVIPSNTELTMLAPPVATAKRELRRHSEYLTPISFNHQVLHSSAQDTRPRRYTNTELTELKRSNSLQAEEKALPVDSTALSAQRVPQERARNLSQKEQPKLIKQTQSFHDIYMQFKNPQQRNFGHVEFQPQKRFEKRFESLNNNNGNHHRGEIVWADATGGYGEHHWDLTQGKLR